MSFSKNNSFPWQSVIESDIEYLALFRRWVKIFSGKLDELQGTAAEYLQSGHRTHPADLPHP
jgi:hypothetical protein